MVSSLFRQPRFVAFFGVLLLGWVGFNATASAQGVPDISLDKTSQGRVLFGSNSDVTLRASNPAGQPVGYNTSFRDVLPPGVTYVAGSSPDRVGEPQIINNAPGAGQTTLIWENVADLTPNSSFEFTFQVTNNPPVLKVGDTYTNQAGAYLNCDPRYVPDFNDQGQPVQTGGNADCTGTPPETSYTGWATDTANTRVEAIRIEKAEPSPESQLLRGLHDHQTVYTLTIRNNHVNPSNGLTVEDYLPAGLEFLGCGTADNTTDAPTNPGSADEYPGSGPINPGNAPAAPDCVEPDVVETVLNPAGLPAGVYTHVVWQNVANMAVSDVVRLQYVAAVPIRENTMNWSGATPGTAGAQTANLDNNSGPETTHHQGLTNHASAAADYQVTGNPPLPVSDQTTHTVEAMDLRIVKSVNPGTLGAGTISTWNLNIATSEYRYQDNVVVEDTLGNGYCPLGSANYEHTPPPALAECDPTGDAPSAPYTSVVEQANGTWLISWDSSTYPALARIQPNQVFNLTFPTRTRQYYQQNFQNDRPVAARDSAANDVDIAGDSWVICAPGAPSPCPVGSPNKIDNDWTDGTRIDDDSHAGQEGGGPTIDKQVKSTANGDCSDPAGYASGNMPVGRPGDWICWRLTMTFPDHLISNEVAVTDFIPLNSSYVAGSTVVMPANTVTIATGGPPEPDLVSPTQLKWPLDDGAEDLVHASDVFDVVFATRVERPTGDTDGELRQNLMKAVYRNSSGTTFPLRDSEDMEMAMAEIDLLKGVRQVNGLPAAGNPPNTDGLEVVGGDNVTYRVDLYNQGSIDAENTQVWDRLPSQVVCADVTNISNGGTCNVAQNRIEWSGLTVAPGGAMPANPALTLTYDVEIPDGLGGRDELRNHAGVRQFENSSGTGPYVQIPSDNIDPTQEPNANVPPADDPSNVFIEDAVMVKTRSTQIDQPGNNAASQATIGELVTYTVTATIPEGTSFYGDDTALVDNVTPRLTVTPGSAAATLDNGNGTPVALPTAGLTLTQTGNSIRIDFPNPYSNTEHSGDDKLVLTFTAQVNDQYPTNYAQGNSTQYTIPNTANLSWKNASGGDRTASGSVNTTVVEPRISIDKTADTAGPVAPGEVIGYTVQTSNGSGARVSTANGTVVTDVVPVGLTPVNGSPPVPVTNGGTVNPDGGIWNAVTRTITWPSVATIAPGASNTVTYRAQVDDPAVGAAVLRNHAVARTTSMPGTVTGERDSTSNPPGGVPGYQAEDEVPLPVRSSGIAKTGSPANATVGEHVTNKLTVTIPALTEQYDVTVTDDLPDGLIFDQYLAAQCLSGCTGGATDINPVTLNAITVGNGQRIGWWLGDLAAAADERVVELTYRTHIGATYNGGGDVVRGDTLTNNATLLSNTTQKITTPPTDPPVPEGYDEVKQDDHDVTVVEPTIVLDKSVSGDDDNDDARTTEPGDSYTYSIKVTNTGNSPAYDLVVTDEPDAELTNVVVATSPAWQITKNWSAADREINWSIPGPIPPNGSVTLTYTADLIPSSGLTNLQTVGNTADVPSYWGVPKAEREDPGNSGVEYREYDDVDDDTVTLTVLIPKLELVKTTGLSGYPDTGVADTESPFPWRIVINNPNIGSKLLGVDLTDTLPPNWTYNPGSTQITGSGTLTPGGQVEPTVVTAATGDVLSWENIANLVGIDATDQRVIIEFEATPKPAAAINPGLPPAIHVNDAEATGEDTSGATGSADGPYRDEDDADATLNTPVVDLGITKVADDPTPVAGTNTTWTLTVTNHGDQASPAVHVSDLLPAGLTYVSAVPEQGTCEESPAGTVSCELGEMAVDQQVKIALTTRVGADTAGQTLINPADVSDPYIDDQNPGNDHSEDEVKPTASADVEIRKAVTRGLFAGKVGTYGITVTNHGPSVAKDVTVTDTLPANLTYSGSSTPVGTCTGSGQDFSCDLGSLAPGQSVVVELTVNVLEGGDYTNCATAGGSTTDPDQTNNRSCVDAHAANTDLEIEKTGPAYIPDSGEFSYRLTVTNVGDQPSGGTVTVTDRIPDPLDPVTATGSGWTCEIAGQMVTCTRSDSLAPKGSFPVIRIQVKVNRHLTGSVKNSAHVNLPGDPVPDNDDSASAARIKPVLQLQKKGNRKVVKPGQKIRYTVKFRNRRIGSVAKNVRICDRIPNGLTVVNRGGGRFVNGRLCWNAKRLKGTKRWSKRHYVARVSPNAKNGAKLKNVVFMKSLRSSWTVTVKRPRPPVKRTPVTG